MPLFLGTKRAYVNFFIDAPSKEAAMAFMRENVEAEHILECKTPLDREGFYQSGNAEIKPADEDETWDVRVDEHGEIVERNPSEWETALFLGQVTLIDKD